MKQHGIDDFVVESTPVLDIKKQGLGVGSDSPSSAPNWDADRTEVYADIDESDVIATLSVENGESYPITTFPFVIGRGTECDLVLQGKGISRKHAEIIFQSGRFVVNDLESLNGLKVNGYKVARVILEESDQIKLGEVSLVFRSGTESDAASSGDAEPKSGGLFGRSKPPAANNAEDDTFGPSPVKKMFTTALIALAITVFAAAGFLYYQKQTGTTQVAATSPAAEARKAKVTSEAAPQSAVNSDASASRPAPVVSAETLAPSASAPPPPSALAPPPSLSNLSPKKPEIQKPVSERVAAAVTPVEPKPTPAPKKVVNRNQDAQRAVANAERFYLQGNGASAISTLKPFVGNQSVTGGVSTSVKESYRDISNLFDQYNQAQTAFDKGDKDLAFNLWTDFMSREEKLLGQKSAYSRSIASRVVDEYVARGNLASSNGDFHSAYKNWQSALDVGDSVAAKIALDNLNNRARQLYRQALRLEYVNANKAKGMWQEVTQLLPPGTDYHTKASSKLAWYDKWGT
jgi:tetratricopeptide (TPR) repeat protein